jgi:hypothetical protein
MTFGMQENYSRVPIWSLESLVTAQDTSNLAALVVFLSLNIICGKHWNGVVSYLFKCQCK